MKIGSIQAINVDDRQPRDAFPEGIGASQGQIWQWGLDQGVMTHQMYEKRGDMQLSRSVTGLERTAAGMQTGTELCPYGRYPVPGNGHAQQGLIHAGGPTKWQLAENSPYASHSLTNGGLGNIVLSIDSEGEAPSRVCANSDWGSREMGNAHQYRWEKCPSFDASPPQPSWCGGPIVSPSAESIAGQIGSRRSRGNIGKKKGISRPPTCAN